MYLTGCQGWAVRFEGAARLLFSYGSSDRPLSCELKAKTLVCAYVPLNLLPALCIQVQIRRAVFKCAHAPSTRNAPADMTGTSMMLKKAMPGNRDLVGMHRLHSTHSDTGPILPNSPPRGLL